jgi:hypothetical protein
MAGIESSEKFNPKERNLGFLNTLNCCLDYFEDAKGLGSGVNAGRFGAKNIARNLEFSEEPKVKGFGYEPQSAGFSGWKKEGGEQDSYQSPQGFVGARLESNLRNMENIFTSGSQDFLRLNFGRGAGSHLTGSIGHPGDPNNVLETITSTNGLIGIDTSDSRPDGDNLQSMREQNHLFVQENKELKSLCNIYKAKNERFKLAYKKLKVKYTILKEENHTLCGKLQNERNCHKESRGFLKKLLHVKNVSLGGGTERDVVVIGARNG